jgi:hypothetical protein
MLDMKTTRKTSKAARKYTPSAEQWNPETISDATAAPGFKDRIQFWTAGGSMTLVTVARAKDLVRARAAFVGGPLFINQVHDGIDGANA